MRFSSMRRPWSRKRIFEPEGLLCGSMVKTAPKAGSVLLWVWVSSHSLERVMVFWKL